MAIADWYSLNDAHRDGWTGDEARDFVTWRNQVTRACVTKVNIYDSDLVGDWRYADAFQDGISPSEAASLIIKEAEDEVGISLTECCCPVFCPVHG